MLNYVDSLQNYLAGYVVAAIGYLCSALNMFNIKQISAIRRVLYLTAIPAMMFYQIGKSEPTKKVWSSLLVAFLVQVTLHIIFAIVSWVFPFSNHKARFLICLFAVTHCDFLMFGSPLAQYLWDPSNYISVAVISSICEFFIITPIHSILTFHHVQLGDISDYSDSSIDYDFNSKAQAHDSNNNNIKNKTGNDSLNTEINQLNDEHDENDQHHDDHPIEADGNPTYEKIT